MSRLAHATFAAQGFEAERRALDKTVQWEIRRAKAIQAQTHCTWDEALREARDPITAYYTDRNNSGQAALAK